METISGNVDYFESLSALNTHYKDKGESEVR